MPTVDSIVQIIVEITFHDATFIRVSIKGPNSGRSIQILKIIYLVAPSVYNIYIFISAVTKCITGTCIFDFTLNPAMTVSLTSSYSTSLTADNYQVAGFLNGLNIAASNNSLSTMGLSLNVTLYNITHCSVSLLSISSEPILLNKYFVTIIVFKTPSISFGVKITTLTLSSPNTINDASISTTTTFFGMYQYSFQNADFQFSIDINNNDVTKNISSNMISFKVQLINFQVGACCRNTPLLDATNSSCTDTCPDRNCPVQYSGYGSMGCQKCRYDCFTCDNLSSCLSCNITTDFRQLNPVTLRCDPISGYYDPGVVVALPCIYPNCCGYTPVIYLEGLSCLVTCPVGFAENSTTRVCYNCNSGYWAVSGHCTNVIGCVATIKQNSNVQCIFCRVADHFILQNQICICSQGYILDKLTGKCLEICGDGIHFSQECDDNNTEDGDGCSSSCRTEDYFLCESNSSYILSQCAYIGTISLSFNSANKTEGKNQAVFSFGFSAKYTKLNPAKLVNNFTFSCDPRITIVMMSASKTEVLLYVDYEEDLEGKLGTVEFGLNPKSVILNISLSITFLMVASKEKLIFFRIYPIIISLKKAIEVLAFLTLGVFVVASLTYRMIAVELLHSFLFVYLLCLENSDPTEAFMVFKNLRILAFNFDSVGNYFSQGNVLPYSFQNQLATKQALALFLLAALVGVSAQKIVRECLRDSQGKLAARQAKALKVVRYAFRSLLFSISIGYGYQAIMPSFISSSSEDNQQTYQYQVASLVFFLVICFNFLFFVEFRQRLCKKTGPHTFKALQIQNYPSFYLLFWLSIMLLIAANAIHKVRCLQQISLAFFLLFSLWFLSVRPYSSYLHNAGQLINLTTDILFVSWSTGRRYSSQLTEQYTEAYISIAIVILMYVSIILSLCRIVHVIFSACQPSTIQVPLIACWPKDEGLAQECENIQGAFEKKDKYRIRSILLNQQLLELDSSLQPIKQLRWKRELMTSLREKYKLKKGQNKGISGIPDIKSK